MASTQVERYFYNDSPHWRYDRATIELRMEKEHKLFSRSSDPGVVRLKGLIKTKAAFGATQPQLLSEFYSELFAPLHLHLNNDYRRDAVEAAMLTGASWEDIRNEIDPQWPIRAYQFYADCFFDVRDHLKRLLWLDRNVFSPSRRCDETRIYTCFVWKIIAFRHGMHGLLRATQAGSLLSDSTLVEQAKAIAAEFHIENILRCLALSDRLSKEQRVPLAFGMADKVMSDKAKLNMPDQAPQGLGAFQLGQIGRSLSSAMHMNSELVKDASAEERVDTIKYLEEPDERNYGTGKEE